MNKKEMSDIIPPEKRTIRRVQLSKKDLRADEPEEELEQDTPPEDITNETPDEKPEKPPVSENTRTPRSVEDRLPPRPPHVRGKRSSSGRSWWKWGIAVLVVIILGIILFSVAFSGATITVEPRIESITINGEFPAQRNATADGAVLPFEVTSLSLVEETTLDATGEREVEERASGKIVVFNDFDSSSQLLIENTRFETPDGLIYRIRDEVTVPGQTTNAEGEIVPGSIEVTVYADETGEEYNIGLTDFTIPGLEGDPRYFNFFARSKTPMTGGFVGVQKIVDENEASEARVGMRERLEDALNQQIRAEIPEGYVMFDNLTSITYQSLATISADKEDEAIAREEGTITALIFDEIVLSSFIAEQTLAAYDGVPVRLESFEDLNVQTNDAMTAEALTLSISGNGRLVWQFDETAVKANLVGANEDAINEVLSNFPAIERAQITIRPFWRSSFPDDPDEITIENRLSN